MRLSLYIPPLVLIVALLMIFEVSGERSRNYVPIHKYARCKNQKRKLRSLLRTTNAQNRKCAKQQETCCNQMEDFCHHLRDIDIRQNPGFGEVYERFCSKFRHTMTEQGQHKRDSMDFDGNGVVTDTERYFYNLKHDKKPEDLTAQDDFDDDKKPVDVAVTEGVDGDKKKPIEEALPGDYDGDGVVTDKERNFYNMMHGKSRVA